MLNRNIAKLFALTAFLAISIPASGDRRYPGHDFDDFRGPVARNPSHLPQCDQGPMIIPPCPAGTQLVIHDQPEFDEDGLFVICLKKVPYCLPDNLRPEG